MKKSLYFSILVIFASCLIGMAANINRILFEFSCQTAEENNVTLQGAGFGQYPQADVAFGYIPTDNAFDGATDGQGVIITAKPGEGVMVFGQKINTTNAALVRCSIRTDQPTASVLIATIGDKPDEFVATNTPNHEGYFTGQYLRLQTFCTPPSTGFQPVIQILNTSKTESLTAYLDNLEVYLLDPYYYYSAAFLDGDETDPPADKISVPSDSELGAFPTNLTIPLTDGVSLEMKLIGKGEFMMGSPTTEPDRVGTEEVQHQVTITKSFYIGKYEVTQAQWEAVMGSNPSNWKGSNLPVEQVSWDDCQTFLTKLNLLNQGTFRLPTEAEWEYACRAGTTTRFYWGADMGNTDIANNAWDGYNSDSKTHEVGKKLPNSWGLYDTSGNVLEWCQDWHDDYPSSSQVDPTGPSSGQFRVYRGGYWNCVHHYCRSARRFSNFPYFKSNGVGLRIIRLAQ